MRGGKQRRPPMLQDLGSVVRIPDWRLTTAALLYHMPDNHAPPQTLIWPTPARATPAGTRPPRPDNPPRLQAFSWQKLDRAPGFPELSRFLDFWRREIEGPLHSVRVASSALIRPAELRYADGQFTLH